MMTESTAHHTRYAIRVRGQLDAEWQAWFDDLSITADADGNSTLHGVIVDQAALFGILKRVNKLGLHLISVNPQPDE